MLCSQEVGGRGGGGLNDMDPNALGRVLEWELADLQKAKPSRAVGEQTDPVDPLPLKRAPVGDPFVSPKYRAFSATMHQQAGPDGRRARFATS